ncbi:MAG: glycosyltransferase family 4 protein [Legionella sp.]|nr:glycosyltransferase family 4 protein [Legionella sp.]
MVKKIHKSRIARISTVPFFIYALLRTQVRAIAATGANVTLITSPDDLAALMKNFDTCQFMPLSIHRDIRSFSDIRSLIQLIRIFRSKKFDIVHSNTPKAGLLSAIAGRIIGVPIRLHTFTGQTWVTMSGFKRTIIKFCDKVIGWLNTHCYADSPSQRDFLIKEKVIDSKKISVLGIGSLGGVDVTRFNANHFPAEYKNNIRKMMNINEPNALILLFLGRITHDKGVRELIDAFSWLLKNKKEGNLCDRPLQLLMVGPFEQGIEKDIKAYAKKKCNDRVIFSGLCLEPENFIAIADILCLPSYREGFGTVVIEAAAMGVPTIGTNIYGLNDAVVDGETGLLVEPRNVMQLKEALTILINNEALRNSMGEKAKKRALEAFDSRTLDQMMIQEYEKLLESYVDKSAAGKRF